jgi:glyoxylase-like metal-dependent hydrolase (beta-lactamase superfamily II)
MTSPRILALHKSTPLEDEVIHVLHKALRGAGISADEFPQHAGISQNEWSACLAGHGSHPALTSIARSLHLHAPALIGLPQYSPSVPPLQEVLRCDLPFESDRVNAWILNHQDAYVLFDAGFGTSDCVNLLDTIHAQKVDFFLTHRHRDHLGGLPSLLPRIRKNWQLSCGETASFASLTITSIDLTGHASPAFGYIVHGLSRTLCVVGDALFAGSIGGCADPTCYQLALRLLRQQVMSLPPDTILLPGHGPATTVEQEARNNPFLAIS